MSNTIGIDEQDVARFRDDLLRLQITCNSLKAFASEEGPGRTGATEARSLARFFEQEFPKTMQRNEAFLAVVIRARGTGDHAARAALEVLREDHDRLNRLAGEVLVQFHAPQRSRREVYRDGLQPVVSAFLAAQRNYMEWWRKIVDQADPGPRRDP